MTRPISPSVYVPIHRTFPRLIHHPHPAAADLSCFVGKRWSQMAIHDPTLAEDRQDAEEIDPLNDISKQLVSRRVLRILCFERME